MTPAVRRIAFLFPGQGSLPARLPRLSDRAVRLFEAAEAVVGPLRERVERGERDRLSATDLAQPVIFIDSVARDESLRAHGLIPEIVAGHSLGEYAALVAARVLSPEEALALVLRRGREMACISGAMAAIVKLPLDDVRRLCAETGPEVVVANENGPTQAVVSGPPAAIESVVAAAAARGGRGIPLHVSGPFHSPAMGPAEAALRPDIERARFRTPSIPLVSSVTGTIEHDPERLRDLLARQITACVRWSDVINRLIETGITDAVEVGAGNVLAGMGRRTTDRIRFLPYEEACDAAV